MRSACNLRNDSVQVMLQVQHVNLAHSLPAC